jgi:hypothetical protein
MPPHTATPQPMSSNCSCPSLTLPMTTFSPTCTNAQHHPSTRTLESHKKLTLRCVKLIGRHERWTVPSEWTKQVGVHLIYGVLGPVLQLVGSLSDACCDQFVDVNPKTSWHCHTNTQARPATTGRGRSCFEVLRMVFPFFQEREAAKQKFLDMTLDQVQQQVRQPVMIIPEARAGDIAEPAEMTVDQTMAVQVAIANAATLEEVHRLETALKAGRMPELPEASAMEEG